MRMIVEQLVEWRLAGETEVLGENLPQRHFVQRAIVYVSALFTLFMLVYDCSEVQTLLN
jgi:hypothetical protein